ncbi:MAG: PRC-barrel domain-containing protein [Candidatus Limnocylindria bacterium]
MTTEKTPVRRDQETKLPALSRLHDIAQTVAGSDEDIRGRMVKDKNGQDIGKIEHLLIDDAEHKVRFMEVAAGGLLHLGETKSFIPVEAITRITDDGVHIGPTREHVAGAPRYDPDLVAADTGSVSGNYFYNLYPYYGYLDYGYLGVPPLVGYPSAESDTPS